MPGGKTSIFISYAHDDNDIVDENNNIIRGKGWVTGFHRRLQIRLNAFLGKGEFQIWRDENLQGNSVFDEELHKQLVLNDVLVCIYSPSYLASEWCKREVFSFVEDKEEKQAISVDSLLTVFKVSKIQIDIDSDGIPDILKRTLDYKFHKQNGMELDPMIEKSEFEGKITELALDIREVHKKLSSSNKDERSETTPEPDKYAYLAESPDCLQECDRVRRELKAHGYKVVPDQALTRESLEQYKGQVREYAERSELMIQLLGEHDGAQFGGPPLVGLQNEVLHELHVQQKKKFLVWIRNGEKEGNMKTFISMFYDQVDKLPVTEDDDSLVVLEDQPVDEINQEVRKFIAQQKIPKMTKKVVKQKSSAVPGFLFIVNSQDLQSKNFVPLYKYLVSVKKVEVKLARIPDTEEELRVTLMKSLERVDGVIYHYGNGDQQWLEDHQDIVMDLMSELGKTIPQCVYKAEPEEFMKEIYESQVYDVVNGIERGYENNETLDNFLKKTTHG